MSDREFHNLGLGKHSNLSPDQGRWAGIPFVKNDFFNGLGDYSNSRLSETNEKIKYLIQKPNNHGEFKTPTLRNIANTAPYMHDGRFKTLEEVLLFYSQLGPLPLVGHREETLKPLHLTSQEIQDLIAFLKTLTGQPLPLNLTQAPKANELHTRPLQHIPPHSGIL